MLDSDAKEFCGHSRLDHSVEYFTSNDGWDNRKYSLKVYIDEFILTLLGSFFNFEIEQFNLFCFKL